MKALTLVLRGLAHYRRTNAGVVAGGAVATATLVGALVVGDSVRASLREQALARIGRADAALVSGDRFFRDALADEVAGVDVRTAPAILVPAVASTADSARRVHDVQVLGIDRRFLELGPGGGAGVSTPGPGEALLSEELARRLAAAPGDEIVVRVERPSAIPRDMVLALDDVSQAVRVEVAGVLDDAGFGRFGLRASQVPPANLFVSLEWLQGELEVPGRANLMLADQGIGAERGPARLRGRLREALQLDDLELELRDLPDGRRELRTSRVFIDDPVASVLEHLEVELTGVLTYFVNEIRAGERATPYSTVSALGRLQLWEPPADLEPPEYTSILNPLVGDDEIVLGQWMADDLGAKKGDAVTLRYFVIDPSRRLVEAERTFTVDHVVPVAGLAADPELMPDFPGLTDAENCRDWDTGVPIDLDRIRDKDEAYWDEHRGTPKAFVTLAAGREMWASRFGSLTAVRFDAGAEKEVRRALADDLDPAALGLFFTDVRTPALDSASSPTDFGGLFVGLSFFLIAGALLLTSLLFLFGVDQRAREIGLYAALGFHPRTVRRLFFAEALALSVVGAVLGAALGLGYTRIVLAGLATIWRGAVASAVLGFHASAATVVLGAVLSVLVTAATVWLALRKKLAVSSFRLMSGETEPAGAGLAGRRGQRIWRVVAVVGVAGGLAIVLAVDPSSGPEAAGAFFGGGTLVLIGGIAACRLVLRRPVGGETPAMGSIRELGMRGARRRYGRSMATVVLMAIGVFLVLAVGVNRLGPPSNVHERSSGTGGFALYGRTSLPVVRDLSSARGREVFGLSEAELEDVSFVPFRVHAGDDASCLNLSAPQNPRLIGVRPALLGERGAFTFASREHATDDPWELLEETLPDGAVPAIGDATSLQWQLHKGVGDTLDYTDERGRPFTVRIVGAIADSVLQGDLVIAEDRFEERFPSAGGHRLFLIDAPPARVEEVSATLSRALADVGLSLERTDARLAAFHAVQNGYLAIFQALGALGLLLGSVGLGMVVLRNTLERRGELALADALGFRRRDVRRWVSAEYSWLLALGLGTGTLAALVAILPALRAPGADLPVAMLLLLLALVAANGFLWIALATRAAVQRTPLAALSEE